MAFGKIPQKLSRFRDGFQNLPIRTKLLATFLSLFTLVALAHATAIRWMLMRIIHGEVESKLETTTTALENLVRAAIDASISSYLRGIAERDADIIQSLRSRVRSGRMTETEAHQKIQDILASHHPGITGYVFALNRLGIVVEHPHPNVRGADLSQVPFIQEVLRNPRSTLTYRWSNPGEPREKPKVLVSAPVPGTDWILCATAYRDEFRSMVDVREVRNRILEVRFGVSGYPFILDSQGTLLVHPTLEGQNISQSQDARGRRFIQDMLRMRSGRILYPWRNPGERFARDKVVVFRTLDELGWTVASSCYLSEFRQPETYLATFLGASLALSIGLAALATWWLSRYLSRPLVRLHAHVTGSGSELAAPAPVEGTDEVGRLAEAFNAFLARMSAGRKNLQASERQHRELFEYATVGIFSSTRDGRYLSANPFMARQLGYDSPEEMMATVTHIGHQIYVDPEQKEALWQRMEETGMAFGVELPLRRRDGSILHAALNVRAIPGPDGELAMEGFLRDITEERLAREALLEQQRELEARVHARTLELQAGIQTLERQNGEIAILQELTEMLQLCGGLDEIQPVLAVFLARLFPDTQTFLHLYDPGLDRLTERVRSTGAPPQAPFAMTDCWALRSGKPHWLPRPGARPDCSHGPEALHLERLCVPLQTRGECHGVLELRREPSLDGPGLLRLGTQVAERLSLALTTLKLQESLREQSIRDPLTGLYNRRFLEEAGERELRLASRTRRPLGLVLFDIDHFKQFNDTHGHDAGDAVLRQVARHVQSHLRATDLAFRYGGEEFLLLLPDSDLGGTAGRAEVLRRTLDETVVVLPGNQEHHLTISVGVAAFPQEGGGLEALVKAADIALYRAKGEGRNRVIVSD